jgi:hypothetical protein
MQAKIIHQGRFSPRRSTLSTKQGCFLKHATSGSTDLQQYILVTKQVRNAQPSKPGMDRHPEIGGYDLEFCQLWHHRQGHASISTGSSTQRKVNVQGKHFRSSPTNTCNWPSDLMRWQSGRIQQPTSHRDQHQLLEHTDQPSIKGVIVGCMDSILNQCTQWHCAKLLTWTIKLPQRNKT